MHFLPIALFFLVSVAKATPASYTAIITCLSNSGVPQEVPNTPSFSQASLGWNLRLNFTPIAIAVPSTIPQIQAAVTCGRELGIKVNPKSGGHSYASHSIGGEDGHLVIDLKYLNSIEVDETGVATLGPGARLGNIAVKLFDSGGWAFGHGTCPGVGIGGHLLHGGQGFATHTYGLALDFLIEATIALADSSLVTASSTQNPDLFWALRGAGMSFGIVTSFKLQTIAAPEENVLFYYPYLWNSTQARAGWDAFQSYCGGFTSPIISREMNIRLVIGNIGDGTNLLFLFEGVYHGSQAAFELDIRPFLDSLAGVGGLEVELAGNYSLGWLDSLTYANNNDLFSDYGSGEVLETPLNYTAHFTMFGKSLMTDNLSPAGIDAWIHQLYTSGTSNPRSWYFIIAAQGGPTSIMSTIAPNTTSYAHRARLYEWQLVDAVISGPYPNDIGIPWLNAFVDVIEAAEPRDQVPFGMYYNYADPTLGGGAKAGWRYWKGNYEALSVLKGRLDPGGVFGNPQTVEGCEIC